MSVLMCVCMWMISYFTSVDERNPAPAKNEIFSMSLGVTARFLDHTSQCQIIFDWGFPFVNFRHVFKIFKAKALLWLPLVSRSQQPSHVLQVATYEQTCICIWCKCPVAKLFGIDPAPMRRQNLLNSSLSWIFMFAKRGILPSKYSLPKLPLWGVRSFMTLWRFG